MRTRLTTPFILIHFILHWFVVCLFVWLHNCDWWLEQPILVLCKQLVFLFVCFYHMRNTNIHFPKSIKCLSNNCLMSVDCLLNVLWLFIEYLSNICGMSIKCLLNVHGMSVKCPANLVAFPVSYSIFEHATSWGFYDPNIASRDDYEKIQYSWNSQVKLTWIRLIGWTSGLLLHTGHKTQQ